LQLPYDYEPQTKHAAKLAYLIRDENNICTPYTPVKRLLKQFSRLYYFCAEQNPDFMNEAGFTVLERDGKYKTYINAGLSEGRDKFTLAHELGHIVIGHHLCYKTDLLTDREYAILDREANAFAASLMMPEDWVKHYCTYSMTTGNIGKMKQLFGVSWAAMIKRLDELGIQSGEDIINRLNRGRFT
jgi:Zn-dependent peptidase ImmA (M78 family)